MLRRLFKQFVYGLFYLVIFTLVVGVIYFIWRPAATCFDNQQNRGEEGMDCGGPCVACAIKNLVPLRVLPLQFFQAGDVDSDAAAGVTVLAQVENLNTAYGVARGDFQLTLYDVAGNVVYNLSGATIVAPGEKKKLLFPAIEAGFTRIYRGELGFSNVDWRAAQDWPVLNVDAEIARVQFIGQQAVLDGRLGNSGPSAIGRVKIGVLLFDKKGLAINGSQTTLEDVAPFSVRNFKVSAPLMGVASKDVDIGKSQIFWEIEPGF